MKIWVKLNMICLMNMFNSPTQGYMVCKICKQKVDNVFYDDIGDKIDFSSTRWNHLDKQHGINNFDDIRRYVVSNEWIF